MGMKRRVAQQATKRTCPADVPCGRALWHKEWDRIDLYCQHGCQEHRPLPEVSEQGPTTPPRAAVGGVSLALEHPAHRRQTGLGGGAGGAGGEGGGGGDRRCPAARRGAAPEGARTAWLAASPCSGG